MKINEKSQQSSEWNKHYKHGLKLFRGHPDNSRLLLPNLIYSRFTINVCYYKAPNYNISNLREPHGRDLGDTGKEKLPLGANWGKNCGCSYAAARGRTRCSRRVNLLINEPCVYISPSWKWALSWNIFLQPECSARYIRCCRRASRGACTQHLVVFSLLCY